MKARGFYEEKIIHDFGVYDRSKFDALGGKSSYEEADEEKGYLFSIRQYYYDGDYRYGMGDPLFYELFQPTRNDIVAFYSWDDLSRLMILSVEYADSAPVSIEKEALKIAGYMTPDSDVYLENVYANPWNLKFANFLLNGRFRDMGQEYFDGAEILACLFDVAGDDYPELIITNGAADGQSTGAYIYTFSENWQVEYLRTATTEELQAMPLQAFTAIRMGWGDFLEACGYQMEYLPVQISQADWLGTYQYDDGDHGELYIVEESDDSEVRSVYVFCRTDGGYDSRDFVWSKDNSSTASEPFQNGSSSDRIFHYLKGDRIVLDYPDGWWQDRDYVRVSSAEHSYFEEAETGVLVSYAGATVDFKGSLFEKSFYEYDNELAKRIFAYTYGAIDSIDVNMPVYDGYEYIHNIYNSYDTFGPKGEKIFTTSGNSGMGKFGHVDRFHHQFSKFNNVLDSANHDISNYLTAIVEGEVICNSS